MGKNEWFDAKPFVVRHCPNDAASCFFEAPTKNNLKVTDCRKMFEEEKNVMIYEGNPASSDLLKVCDSIKSQCYKF